MSGGPKNPVHNFAEAERIAEAYRESSSPLEDAPVSGEEEPAGIGGVTKPRTGVSDPVDLGHAGQKLGRSAVKQTPPLTPAEKQKAYRERHADEVRKRDRERKAAKRREALE